jgi:peptidoglycan/LPS O-acetylase OafA/YrhL
MSKVERFLMMFQRVTSSTRFIPEIDGLRFIAISSVVLTHLVTFFSVKDLHSYGSDFLRAEVVHFSERFAYGVQLFFIISGFVLSLPFALYHEGKREKPRMKDYFLRRITRLEPPYILSMIVLMVGAILVAKHPVSEILKSFLASLFYSHAFLFPGKASLINAVIWSLEIEVQFYILAPLLANVFRLRRLERRLILVLSIFAGLWLQKALPVDSKTIANYIFYFLIGFLLSDLYVAQHRAPVKDGLISFSSGVVCFLGIWCFEAETVRVLFSIGFFYLVLFTDLWRRVFSTPLLTVIGGMCYSIYLLHYPIISFFGNPLIRWIKVSDSYFPAWLFYGILLIPMVLLLSAAYFLLIEKPCMKRDWYKGLFGAFSDSRL